MLVEHRQLGFPLILAERADVGLFAARRHHHWVVFPVVDRHVIQRFYLAVGRFTRSRKALARQILDSGPFTLDRAYPLTDVLFAVGRIDEVIDLVERVIRIEPLVMFPSRDQQWNLTAARRYREAEAEYRRSREFESAHDQPDFTAFVRTLALQSSNPAAVRAAYDRYHSSLPANGRAAFLDEIAPLLEDRAALRARVQKLIEERRLGSDGAYFIADALGDSRSAVVSLRAFIDAPGNSDFANYWQLWIIPYSNVRTLPGFKDLLREAGIVDYWRQTGNWGDFCKQVGADDFECR